MHLKNTLSKFIFAYLVFCFHSTIAIANAPSSLVGKKIVLSIPDPENNREYGITWIFTTNDELWEFEHENGDWQWAKYEYVKSGSRITAKSVPYHAGGSYDEFILDYTSSTSGNISYTAFEKNDSGNFEIDDQGSATFTMSDYANTDLPPFGTYFSDDFSNSTISDNYWYQNKETSWYGLDVNLGNGKLELTGTGTDLEERWFDVNTKSILPVNEDWVIQADAYADYSGTSNETWNTVIGFEAEYQQYDFEFFVGPSSWGTIAYISYEDPDGTFVHLSATFGNAKTGSYRVRNDISRKTFYAEYLADSSWKEAINVNWQSGAVTGATYSDNGNTDQLSNWISLENYKVQPGITFSIPSDGTNIGSLTSSQLGVSSFSVTKGSQENDPDFASTPLLGRVYTETYQDPDTSESFLEKNFFISETEVITSNFGIISGSIDIQNGTYTWSGLGTNGNLVISTPTQTGTYNLTFETNNSGTSDYVNSNDISINGSFQLSLLPTGSLPDDLTGLIFSELYQDPTTNESFTDKIYFKTSTDIVLLSIGEISGIVGFKIGSYTWSIANNIGNLSTTIPSESEGNVMGSYTLLFNSDSEGNSYYNSENYSTIGTFSFHNAEIGYSPKDLLGDSIIFGKSSYIFKENYEVTIRSQTGSLDSSYRFIKSAENEGFLSISSTEENLTDTIYKMTFSSTGEGTLSQGGSGSFEYFIDGNNQPSTKDWMWFDEYPWVYSHIEGGWLYFMPTSSKLMVFSVKDQAWRNMTE